MRVFRKAVVWKITQLGLSFLDLDLKSRHATYGYIKTVAEDSANHLELLQGETTLIHGDVHVAEVEYVACFGDSKRISLV